MARMTAAEAAVRVLEKEGVSVAFGVPGAAINPFYAAMRAHGRIRHILARHVEGASHMADGYSRARPGLIGGHPVESLGQRIGSTLDRSLQKGVLGREVVIEQAL